jgi:hypothetical protein
MIVLTFILCLMGEICDYEPGEYVVFKFDGPAAYAYTLKSGEARNFTVDKEERILLENTSADIPAEMWAYLRIGPDGVQLFPGLDKDLKTDGGDLVFGPAQATKFQNGAIIFNFAKDGGALDASSPITFTGNFVGIETHRKDFVCKDKTGTEINADKKVPYKDCGGGNKEYNGQMVVTSYDKAGLSEKLATGQNTGLTALPKVPLELVVKNIGTTAPKDSTANGPIQAPTAAAPTAQADTASNCSLQRRAKASPHFERWAWLGMTVLLPAGLALARRRKFSASIPPQ